MADLPTPELAPARMLNEFAYCPRLCYLEWVQAEWADNPDTLDGKFHHRRVDQPTGRIPKPHEPANLPDALEGDPASSPAAGSTPADPIHARSLPVTAHTLGLTAVVDLIEAEELSLTGGPIVVTPVDYKRGSVPDTPERCYEPERVQLAAQGLALREAGYECNGGILYFVESRTRVHVPFTDELIQRTLDLLAAMKQMARTAHIPPPLVDSPKCPRCSLVGICLPDETRLLAGSPLVQLGLQARTAPAPGTLPDDPDEPPIRQLIATRDDARPLYVQEQRAYVGKKEDRIQVRGVGQAASQTLAEIRFAECSHVCLFGHVQVSTQTVHELCDRQIPIVYHSYGGYFRGITTGLPSKNIELRIHQHRLAADAGFPLRLARAWVAGKIENQRTLLRRNHPDAPQPALDDLARHIQLAHRAESIPSLLGIEGNAARLYFSAFPGLLRPRDVEPWADDAFTFHFDKRNRRPPVDPVNALLSFGYAILAKDLTLACWTVGLDPFLGFFHQPRHGKPALALDLMEEFRPIIVDSVVITAINTGVLSSADFIQRGPAVALRPDGRKRFLQAYERRMDSLVTHPVFGYRITYRRVLQVQTRLLARVLTGELPDYPPFTTR